MIKGIILDVDGVIVGEKVGYNSPYPHPDVIKRLRAIEAKNIPISLCTAKPYYAIRKIIDDAGLRNLHITEGGAVIIDPLDGMVLKNHFIDKALVAKVVQTYLEAGAYTEIYSLDSYFLQQSQRTDLTDTHSHVLQTEPSLVDSLADVAANESIVKVMPVAKDEEDKQRLIQLFEPFKNELTLSWGVHPIALPHQFGIITAKGISKQQAAMEIAQYESVKPDELLGVGDSTSDWQFIEKCGYGATMENGSKELKDLIATKGVSSYTGGHVDKNGVLTIFDFFKV